MCILKMKPVKGVCALLFDHRLRADSALNLCTGRPPTGVIIPDAVYYNFDLLMMCTTVLETCRGT